MAFGRYQPANGVQTASQPGLINESVGDQEDYLSLDEPSAGFHIGDLIWIVAIATATAAVLAAVYLYI
jgi:hypothetical protein